jgi:hypothetical protein
MRLTNIVLGKFNNDLAIPFSVGVIESDVATCYTFQFLCFFIGFNFEDIEA